MKILGFYLLILISLGHGQPVTAQTKQGSAPDSISETSTSFLFPTAVPRKKGTTVAKGTYLLGWQFDHQFSDLTAAGLHSTAPVGFLALGPQFKQSAKVSENFYVAVGAAGGFVASLFERRNSKTALYYGTGVMATHIRNGSGVSIGSFLLGGQISGYGHALVADFNAFLRINRTVTLLFDIFTPLAFHNRDDIAFDWGWLTYGARIHGTKLFGDVGFMIPINEDTSDVLRYLPLGIPVMSLGVYF
jgi:hypothetical protein